MITCKKTYILLCYLENMLMNVCLNRALQIQDLKKNKGILIHHLDIC